MSRQLAGMGKVATPPVYWQIVKDPSGDAVVRYAPRGGTMGVAVIALGVRCLLGAAWFAASILGPGVTIFGWILVLIVSGSIAAFGLHCLQGMLYERDDYRLGSASLIASHRSLWSGTRSVEIPRAEITHVLQQYSPPRRNPARSDPGNWVTFVSRKGSDFALSGMTTES